MGLLVTLFVGLFLWLFFRWYDTVYTPNWHWNQCGQPAKAIITVFKDGTYGEYFDMYKYKKNENGDEDEMFVDEHFSVVLKNRLTGGKTYVYTGFSQKLVGDLKWMTSNEADFLIDEIRSLERKQYWDAEDKKKEAAKDAANRRKDLAYEQFKHLIPENERRDK